MDPSTVISEVNSIRIQDAISHSALTLLIFDHSLTFIQEVDLFWKPKLTRGALIFFFNRYIVLGTSLLTNFGFLLVFSPKSCTPIFFTANILNILQFIPWAVFSATRAFALSCKNRLFTALILLLSLIPMGVNAVHFASSAREYYDPVLEACFLVDTMGPVLTQRLTILSRACLIVCDVLLVIATWNTMSRTTQRGLLSIFNTSSTFGAVLLRNGALCFLILAFLNSLHVLLTMLSFSDASFQHASNVVQFISPMNGLLVSRFLLDLQATNRHVLHLDSTFGQNTGTVVFDHGTFSAASLDTSPSGAFHESSKNVDIDGELMDIADSDSLFSEHVMYTNTAGTMEGKDLERGGVV